MCARLTSMSHIVQAFTYDREVGTRQGRELSARQPSAHYKSIAHRGAGGGGDVQPGHGLALRHCMSTCNVLVVPDAPSSSGPNAAKPLVALECRPEPHPVLALALALSLCHRCQWLWTLPGAACPLQPLEGPPRHHRRHCTHEELCLVRRPSCQAYSASSTTSEA